MNQILIVNASSIFLLLGITHGAFALRDVKNPRFFTPPNVALGQAMQESSVRFHPNINLWKAWLGFNLTHSLGIILFGGAFSHIGIFESEVFASSVLFQAVDVSVSAIYSVVSLKFFFSKPAIYSAVGLACFLIAAGLAHT